MREIFYRPRAVADIDGVLTYLALELHSSKSAETTACDILDAIERVAEVPTIGRPLTGDDLQQDYRRIRVKSYWIYYTFDERMLTVWRVFHTSRDTDNYGYWPFSD